MYTPIKITRVKKTNSNLLNLDESAIDFSDTFQAFFCSTGSTLTSIDIAKAFFLSAPKWVDQLFLVRNKLMGAIGLKVAGSREEMETALDKFTCSQGEQIGLFKVIAANKNEVILGEDDKHLNFRISLLIEEENEENRKFSITTTVKFNNNFGKIYFYAIKPFHRLIVPVMLKGIIQQLIQK